MVRHELAEQAGDTAHGDVSVVAARMGGKGTASGRDRVGHQVERMKEVRTQSVVCFEYDEPAVGTDGRTNEVEAEARRGHEGFHGRAALGLDHVYDGDGDSRAGGLVET